MMVSVGLAALDHETAVHDVEIVQVVRLAVQIEHARRPVFAKAARAHLMPQTVSSFIVTWSLCRR